jgi:hypothetical protein
MNASRLLTVLLLTLLTSVAANAGDFFSKRELNIHYVNGASPMNNRGHSLFQSIEFELAGRSKFVERWLKNFEAGGSFTYHDITQARSWFGYTYGDPDDRVRGYQTYFFVRKRWREGRSISPYADLGTGPMFSNRRVPAATSKINMSSQLNLGVTLFAGARFPLSAAYRFSHISDGGVSGRNPGLNVHSVVVGTRVKSFRPH